MKKILCLALTLTILFLLAACGDQTESVSTPPVSGGQDADAKNNTPGAVEEPLDLTAMSSTIVYAEVNHIMMAPENHIGRQITMEGLFYITQGCDENGEIDPNEMDFACIIQDATACCAKGIRFMLADETAVYPEDYPAKGSEIVVTGEFQAYTERGYTYYHLANATLSVKEA